jgi:hypothetical protein
MMGGNGTGLGKHKVYTARQDMRSGVRDKAKEHADRHRVDIFETGDCTMTLLADPFPGPVPPVEQPAPVREPEPDRLPDEEPLPNPDENPEPPQQVQHR